MKKQIMLLAIVLSGIFSMQAQEIEGTQSQSQRTIAEQPRKVTDWSEQPIGIVYGGIGVGHIISAEEGAARTGVDWRIGMSRYYNQWGWGVLLQQLTAWQNTYISNSQQTVKMKDTNRLLYLAPQFTARKMLGKQLTMYGAIGWGWLHYKEAVNLEGQSQRAGRKHLGRTRIPSGEKSGIKRGCRTDRRQNRKAQSGQCSTSRSY